MHELPDALYEDIKTFCAEGDTLAAAGAYKDAIASYSRAWELVPEPQTQWEASTWVLVAIGDACYLGGFFQSGLEAFQYAMNCPDGFGNPFIHLRLGQCALEKGMTDLAADALARAYMLEGKDIFNAEDTKYFAFLKARLEPPASGQW